VTDSRTGTIENKKDGSAGGARLEKRAYGIEKAQEGINEGGEEVRGQKSKEWGQEGYIRTAPKTR